MPELTLAAIPSESGLHVQVRLDEPVPGGALLLSVTGAAGRLLAQERIAVPTGAVRLEHVIGTDEQPLRLKVVLVVGDEVITQQRADLHISLAAFES